MVSLSNSLGFLLIGLISFIAISPFAFSQDAPLALTPSTSSPYKVPYEAQLEYLKNGRVKLFVEFHCEIPEGANLQERMERYNRAREIVLEGEKEQGYKILYHYRYSPVLFIEFTSNLALMEVERWPGVTQVYLDVPGSGALTQTRAFHQIDSVQHSWGFRGQGRTVAVLDTGLDLNHPDFTDRIIVGAHFLNSGSNVGRDVQDGHGHGTNVTGILASGGEVSSLGAVPDADILVVRVLDSANRGWLSDWTAGLEFALRQKEINPDLTLDVVNLSLGTDALYDGVCNSRFSSFFSACQAANELGVAVVAASHNQGSQTSMAVPACYSNVVAVGSLTESIPHGVASFSNRNEHLDVMAIGQRVTASGRGGGLSTFTGTSQACPHVAGFFALTRQVLPAISPDAFKSVLAFSPDTVVDSGTELEFPVLIFSTMLKYIIHRDCDGSGDLSEDELSGDEPNCASIRIHMGDVNQDGLLDITDPIDVLTYLFTDTKVNWRCLKSADWNLDDTLDISDAVAGLAKLFIGIEPHPDFVDGCSPLAESFELPCTLDFSCLSSPLE